jgi:hypothetical protein
MMDEVKTSLKHGIVLLVASQEDLNNLASLEDGVKEDCLHINEPYVAFKDSDSAIQLIPLKEIDGSYPMEFHKPRKFGSWYRSVKNK